MFFISCIVYCALLSYVQINKVSMFLYMKLHIVLEFINNNVIFSTKKVDYNHYSVFNI